jgi:hypothetical protein
VIQLKDKWLSVPYLANAACVTLAALFVNYALLSPSNAKLIK